MFDKFSRDAIKVITQAIEEARTFRHKEVGSEHLLLGVFAFCGDSIAKGFPSLQGIELDQLRIAIKRVNPNGSKTSPADLPFSDEAKHILVNAYGKSRHSLIYPRHILLSMIDKQDSVGVKVLETLGVDLAPIAGSSEGEQSAAILKYAQEEARRLGHNFVGTEQILLGLIIGRGGVGAVLSKFGIEIEWARREVEKIIGRGSGFVAVEIPFTPRARKVLEFSWDEARQLGHTHIENEHLMLGIIREGEGVASHILTVAGVNPDELRAAILALFNESE
ncbi:MAG: hypothetical protein DKT66_09175 [Candidatus Melainabacteria bacterium]|nr:MAG: hypothetical protein DKT66_09175 [Candidatus Melainabacteria bacterium]